jgi:hypothetical protein
MAELTPVQVQLGGADVAKAAADAAGETFRPGDNLALVVANGDTVARTVTVAVPGNTRFGQAQPDVAVTVAAGGEQAIGPFPAELRDPADGLVHVSYDAVTATDRVLVRL